jgi:branched-chain amino acid transport system substrate-binding protein
VTDVRVLCAVFTAAAVATLAACGDDGRKAGEAPPVAKAMSSSICSPMTTAGDGPARHLVALVAPMQNVISDHGIQNAQAAKLVLTQHDWRAGDGGVALQVCDEASADEYSDPDKCERIARSIAAEPSIPVVVGPSASVCAARMIPVLNRAPGGPVAIIGVGSTYLGLTRDGPGVAAGHPERLYPTGFRNYMRTVPADDMQAAGAVIAARDDGARRTFALDDGTDYGAGIAAQFQAAAPRAGMEPVGSAEWDPGATGYGALARRVARARPDAVFLGGLAQNNGPSLIRDLRDALGHGVALLGPDGFNQPTQLVEGAGERAEGMTITLSAASVSALPARGRAWAQEFTRRFGARPCCYAVHAGQAMEVALDAVARSGGDRAGVLRELRGGRVHDGLIGDFAFDTLGDSTLRAVSLWRIAAGRLQYLRTVEVPVELTGRR